MTIEQQYGHNHDAVASGVAPSAFPCIDERRVYADALRWGCIGLDACVAWQQARGLPPRCIFDPGYRSPIAVERRVMRAEVRT